MYYKIIDVYLPNEIEAVKDLLHKHNLNYESNVTETIAVLDKNKTIGTASLHGNIMKMIAVDEEYQNENITSSLISNLVCRLNKKGINKYFIFTLPSKIDRFIGLGFKLVSKTNSVALLENTTNSIQGKLSKLKKYANYDGGTAAAIVMNCNPITNGHLYLINAAAKENDHLIIFLVQENKSFFPFNERFELVKSVTKNISNVIVLPSTEYLISSITFPTYFSKSIDDATKTCMELDATIFKEHFMPVFNISKRYVGTEENDMLTAMYNDTLRNILGEQLVIVERMTINDDIISASRVRELLKNKNFSQIKLYVPNETYTYLVDKFGDLNER